MEMIFHSLEYLFERNKDAGVPDTAVQEAKEDAKEAAEEEAATTSGGTTGGGMGKNMIPLLIGGAALAFFAFKKK
jgi:hypothetical protein